MSRLVSVVVANYNYGRFLAKCLDSVLKQTYAPVQIVVVDDGSTDESRAVLSDYGDLVEPVLQENGGQASAMSAGAAVARGELIAFLDSDDGWYPEKLEASVAAFRANGQVGWLRHKLDLVDENLRPLGPVAPSFSGSRTIEPDPRYLLERVVTAATSSIVVRATALRQVFPLPAQGAFAFDAVALLLARLFAERVRGYSLDRALGWYRRHPGQQYVNQSDVPGMLNRQLAVAAEIARALGEGRDRTMTSFKHRAVIAALEGARWWQPSRTGPLLGGLATAIRYLDRPQLAARQSLALLLGCLAPRRWLERLQQTQRLAGVAEVVSDR
jgi:glycosyltransferase involved in cell wall biosynthesis